MGFGPGASGTGRKSPPTPIHAVSLEEKSGGEAVCCAGAGAVGTAQTRPVKTPPAKSLAPRLTMDIVLLLFASFAPFRARRPHWGGPTFGVCWENNAGEAG